MYPDIFFAIGQFCDLLTQISLRQTCKAAYNGVKITYIPFYIANKLNDNIDNET